MTIESNKIAKKVKTTNTQNILGENAEKFPKCVKISKNDRK